MTQLLYGVVRAVRKAALSFCNAFKTETKHVIGGLRAKMKPITEKRDAFRRARELLAKNDDKLLRYATLELRRCLEAVVYEKLWAYRKRLPQKVARMWQPPQAFKALLLIEPDAATTSTIQYAEESHLGVPASGPYQTLGVDRRPTTGWLTKTYNKLGSFLHAGWPFSASTADKNDIELRRYLEQVVSELEPFVQRSFTCTLAKTLVFRCSVCDTEIQVNSQGVEKSKEVECLNPECGCHFSVVGNDGKISFKLDTRSLNCPECKRTIELPTQKLHIGYRFKCPGCEASLNLSGYKWQARKADYCSGKDNRSN